MSLVVVNASAAEPLFSALPDLIGNAEQLVETHGLNPVLLERASGLVPLPACVSLMVHVQRIAGNDRFAFDLACDPTTTMANVASIALGPGHSGLDRIKAFVAGLNGAVTGTQYSLTLEEKCFWIHRVQSATELSNTWPMIQYNFGIFLAGVQRLLGPGASPVAATIEMSTVPVGLPVEFADIPIKPGRWSGLAFPNRLLAGSPLPIPAPRTPGKETYKELCEINRETIAESIRHLITQESSESLAVRMSRAFGVGMRRYQRHLQKLGSSHGEIVADARLSLANDLLIDEAWSITQIAFELGYRHPGDFTRFFKARTGLSPRAYREARLAV